MCAVGLGWRVLVGESVSEVDLEGSEGVGPAVGALPGGLGALDGEVDEFGGGALVGEVPAGLDRLADLAVEVLDRVGGVDDAAQVLGQRQERVMCSQSRRHACAIIG